MARLSVALWPPAEVMSILEAFARPQHPVAGLEELATVVFEATEGLVPVTHPQPLQANLILARGRVPREFAGGSIAAAWTARSLSLVADRSSPGRPRNEDLAVFPLGRH